MKKSIYLFLAVMLVTVIAILWTRVFTRGSRSQERLSDYPSHIGEEKSESQKDYDLSLRTASRHGTSVDSAEALLNVELLEDASGAMEEKSKSIAAEVEEIQHRLEHTATDVLVDPNKIESQENHAVIQDKQAIAIAHNVIQHTAYDKNGEIRVERLEGKIRVVFPVIKPEIADGMWYLGPDYAAEVYIDTETGNVLQVRHGS